VRKRNPDYSRMLKKSQRATTPQNGILVRRNTGLRPEFDKGVYQWGGKGEVVCTVPKKKWDAIRWGEKVLDYEITSRRKTSKRENGTVRNVGRVREVDKPYGSGGTKERG